MMNNVNDNLLNLASINDNLYNLASAGAVFLQDSYIKFHSYMFILVVN